MGRGGAIQRLLAVVHSGTRFSARREVAQLLCLDESGFLIEVSGHGTEIIVRGALAVEK